MKLFKDCMTLTTRIIQASEDNLKIKFRLRSTPVGRYILFHPYSVLSDSQSGKKKVYGLIESHYYTNSINNELCCIFIDKLAELVVTKDFFHKPCEMGSPIDGKRYRKTDHSFFIPITFLSRISRDSDHPVDRHDATNDKSAKIDLKMD